MKGSNRVRTRRAHARFTPNYTQTATGKPAPPFFFDGVLPYPSDLKSAPIRHVTAELPIVQNKPDFQLLIAPGHMICNA